MPEETLIVSDEQIERSILLLRGRKVMLDTDLAELYGVTTKRLNEQVRRNMDRFPRDFMFQLDENEIEAMRSQIAAASDFRDIKTTMKMDILRCLTPEMINKEILMHFIAYNCVRRLMFEAAEEADIEVRIVSFKGSLQALRNWEPHLNQAKFSKAERFRLISDLYDAMTNTPVRQRPGRSEPRCVKRRPKNYQRMTAPRHQMKEIPHRNRYRAENP